MFRNIMYIRISYCQHLELSALILYPRFYLTYVLPSWFSLNQEISNIMWKLEMIRLSNSCSPFSRPVPDTRCGQSVCSYLNRHMMPLFLEVCCLPSFQRLQVCWLPIVIYFTMVASPLLFIVAFIYSVGVTSPQHIQPEVTTQDGRLQGSTTFLYSVPSLYGQINATIDVFRGVPYAAPPTGRDGHLIALSLEKGPYVLFQHYIAFCIMHYNTLL